MLSMIGVPDVLAWSDTWAVSRPVRPGLCCRRTYTINLPSPPSPRPVPARVSEAHPRSAAVLNLHRSAPRPPRSQRRSWLSREAAEDDGQGGAGSPSSTTSASLQRNKPGLPKRILTNACRLHGSQHHPRMLSQVASEMLARLAKKYQRLSRVGRDRSTTRASGKTVLD